MGGTYDAYSVEHFDDVSGKWKDLPTEWRDDGVGAPMPKCMGGVTAFIGLLGEAQANAIMWQAQAFAESKGERFKLRVVEYQVVYDIKARKVETND
jgi:transposase InsO family protein